MPHRIRVAYRQEIRPMHQQYSPQPQYAAQPVEYAAQPQYAAQPVQYAAQPVAGRLPADHPLAGVDRRISRAARRRVHSRERRIRRTRAAVRSQLPTW
ncbi:hypothetical protein ACQPXM_02455 [Kribbella sp. CA-253562]|uniref:hypothetical protein n=1 Tax=Kribbella sp. CA-253562 TaxID=3239942 RepID=UPI003D8C87D4